MDVLAIIGGSVLMSLAVNLFLQPSEIVTGGLTGVAIIGNALWPRLPIGTTIFVLNVPLILLGFRLLKRRLILWTLVAVVGSSFIIDLGTIALTTINFEINAEPVISAIFGGLLMGLGVGLIFLRGVTTGGSTLAAMLLQIKIPHLSMGKLILIVDVCVVALSAVVFGSIDKALYSGVALFISSRVIDAVIYGPEASGMAHIISIGQPPEIVAAAITKELNRGTTLLHGEGGLDGTPRKIILCAVHRTQLPLLRRVVADVDPRAFVILSETFEVRGLGFQPLEK
jgi:uncharacterized membrane-anchored protein YitT (DUF2179 family)